MSEPFEDIPYGLNPETEQVELHNIFSDSVEKALEKLSPSQLHQLEKNVKRLKQQSKSVLSGGMKGSNPSLGHPYGNAEDLVLQSQAGLLNMDDPHSLGLGLDLDPQMLAAVGVSVAGGGPKHSAHKLASGHSTNLPASCPVLEVRNGKEFLIFTYSTKGVPHEFAIRTDIDDISLEEIPEDFKAENCVYPRACCPREQYVGNRWEYETACNELAWRLCWLNHDVLPNKRGLIQRAVDSYRNRLTEMRSRRVVRQEKLTNGTLRRRTSELGDLPYDQSGRPSPYHSGGGSGSASLGGVGLQSSASLDGCPSDPSMGGGKHKQMTVPLASASKGISNGSNAGSQATKMKVRIDIENVDEAEIDEFFKAQNCIYPEAVSSESIGARRDYEMECNEIAYKLAYLNPMKLGGKKSLLQKAVDCYRSHMDHQSQMLGSSSISDITGNSGSRSMKGGSSGAFSRSTQLPYHHNGMIDHVSHSYLGVSTDDPSELDQFGSSRNQQEFSEMVASTLQQALSGSNEFNVDPTLTRDIFNQNQVNPSSVYGNVYDSHSTFNPYGDTSSFYN